MREEPFGLLEAAAKLRHEALSLYLDTAWHGL
jgi:hypothetical protein